MFREVIFYKHVFLCLIFLKISPIIFSTFMFMSRPNVYPKCDMVNKTRRDPKQVT